MHESVIRFTNPAATLRDASLQWLQRVHPPFRGEVEPRYWHTDGHRYHWVPAEQGSIVARLKLRTVPHYILVGGTAAFVALLTTAWWQGGGR